MNVGKQHSLIIFMHIPKTGGLTLRNIIDQQYSKDAILKFSRDGCKRIPTNRVDFTKIRCLYGHNRFGIHEQIPISTTYITMLRDPINRVISTYYFILARPQNRLHQKVKNMTLEEFITSEDKDIIIPVSNHQTRYLSGTKNPNIEKALKNMEESFKMVGITEMYNESVFLMKQELGWGNIDYQKRNVSKNRPKHEAIPESVIRLIKERNKLDYILYDTAKENLIKGINQLESTLKKQMSKYVERHSEKGKEKE